MDFFCVYIREAHPEDGWQVGENVADDLVYTQPRTLDERAGVAEACVLGLRLAMPTLLEDMDDAVEHAYAALPDRLYVIGANGRVTYQGAPGPRGFDPDAWERAIQETLG